MAASEYHYRTELISGVISKQVELRLTLAISDFSTVKQAIEKLGGRLSCRRPYDENSRSEFPIMVQNFSNHGKNNIMSTPLLQMIGFLLILKHQSINTK